jgi:hypothetical protein
MRFRRATALLAVAIIACMSSAAVAAPLNLLPALPDIFFDSISFAYDANTDVFTVNSGLFASSQLVDPGNVTYPITGTPSLSISAIIDNTGTASAGTLSIDGTIAALSAGPSLLTGFLTNFGFPVSGDDPLEFLFTVAGGDLAVPGLYGTPGIYSVGIILSQTSSNFVDWNTSFDNSANIVGSVIDAFHVVPEPASILLAAPIFLLAAGRSRRRS